MVTDGYDVKDTKKMKVAIGKPGRHLVIFFRAVNARREHGVRKGKGTFQKYRYESIILLLRH